MSSGFNDLIDPDGLLATVLRLRSQEYSLFDRHEMSYGTI